MKPKVSGTEIPFASAGSDVTSFGRKCREQRTGRPCGLPIVEADQFDRPIPKAPYTGAADSSATKHDNQSKAGAFSGVSALMM